MVSAKDGRISGEVVKVVHDDSDEQVQHEEGAQEDETYEVGVGEVGAASFLPVYSFSGGFVEFEG